MMSMQRRTLLLSIRPEHARKIFAGTKKVELRKVRPRVSTGDRVLVYVSSPRRALAGAFSVKSIVSDSPKRLWNTVKDFAGVSKACFDDYYGDALIGHGIVIDKVQLLGRELPLEFLRQRIPGFHPPQCYRYLLNTQVQHMFAI